MRTRSEFESIPARSEMAAAVQVECFDRRIPTITSRQPRYLCNSLARVRAAASTVAAELIRATSSDIAASCLTSDGSESSESVRARSSDFGGATGNEVLSSGPELAGVHPAFGVVIGCPWLI